MKQTSSVCCCRWRTVWTQNANIISDILYRNFLTQLFEILLFCPVKTACFVEYNVHYVLHFVTAIILRYTKNIYKICNCKPHPLKAKYFPTEYTDVIFIQIDQHLKKLLRKYKGSRFYKTRCIWTCYEIDEVMVYLTCQKSQFSGESTTS